MSAVELADEATGEVVYPSLSEQVASFRLPWEPMDADQATEVTSKIRLHGIRMCQEIVAAHEGQAHIALGFNTWAQYCIDKLGVTRQRADQMLAHARKVYAIADAVDVAVESLDISERSTRGIKLEDALEVIGREYDQLPDDAEEATKNDFVKALLSRFTARAKADKPLPSADREATMVASRTEDTAGATDEDDDLDGEVSAPTSPSNLSPEVADDKPADEGDSTGGGDPDTVDPPSDLDGTAPGATIDPENTDAGHATDDAAGETGEPAASPLEAPVDPTGVSTPAAPVGTPSVADLLGLVYAAIDADWAYYSPAVTIDRESFWLPLAVHLESAVEA